MNRLLLVGMFLVVAACTCNAQSYTIPFETNGGRLITFPCHIRDVKRELRCVLDTAATTSVVNSHVVQPTPGDARTSAVSIGGQTTTYFREVLFDLSNHLLFKTTSQLAPLGDLDVLLGQDFLRSFREIAISYQKKELHFEM